MACAQSVIYYHHDCTDGRVAASMLSKHLTNAGTKALLIRSASANMSRFDLPPPGTGTVYFVDLCPTEPLVEEIERRARYVVILDHHMSSVPLCERLRTRGRWTIRHHLDMCGAQIVDKYYPRQQATPNLDAALEAVAAFDLWLDPVDDVFCFKFGTDSLWRRVVEVDEAATYSQCNAFWDALASTSYDEVVALGKPALALVKAEYDACQPFRLQFDATPAWDGRAVAIMLKSNSNPSILGHWLLAEHREEVMIGVWPERSGAHAASLRSRTLCIPSTLPWAKGHSCACGGILPEGILPQLSSVADRSEK